MKLREIENYGLKILNEKAKDGSMIVYAKFSEAEKRNQNSRIYPLEILSREVDRVQAKIASGQFLGQSDHSDSPATFLKDVSHIVTGLEMVGNDGYATIKILNTDAGRNCQEIIKGKGKIGISTRSVGTVDAKTGRIQKDLRLLALDLVANPSVEDATIGKENILEGLEFEEHEDKDTIADKEQVMYELLQASYGRALDGGYEGDFDFYCTLHENGLRKVMHLPTIDFNSEKKLTEEAVSGRIYSFYQEAVQGGFIGTISEFKEKFPKLVEQALERVTLSEKKKEIKEPFKSKATWVEIQASGFRGTMLEYEKQFPNITIIKPEPPQKAETITEAEKKVREVEIEQKLGKAIREKVIRIVSRDVFNAGGGVSQEKIKEMIEMEIKAEKERIKELNWQAYKRLLSD